MPTWDVTTEIVASSFTLDGDKNITPGDGSMFHLDTSTLTDASTAASGTATKFTSMTLEAPTLAAENASVTTSDAATLYISGAPAIGCNQTVTRAHSLWVDSGNVRFDGGLYMGTTQLVTNALAIDNGTANITSGGILKIDVDSGATIDACGGGINAAGSIALGAGNDAGLYVSGDDLYIENKTSDNDLVFRVNDGGVFKEVARVVGSVGAMKFSETTDPGDPGGGNGGYLYAKADGKPYWRSNEIAETALDGGGGCDNAVRVYHTAAQSIANTADTVLAWDSESYDPADMHAACDNTKLTAKTAGKYLIVANIEWAAHVTGWRNHYIREGGDTTVSSTRLMAVDGNKPVYSLTGVWDFGACEYVELVVHHNRGDALILNNGAGVTTFAMHKIC